MSKSETVERNNGDGPVFIVILMLLSVLSLALVPSASGANDPGHDTLYVLKLGDSNVTGSINLTGNVTALLFKYTTVIQGNYLDIWANSSSSPYAVSSRPAIQAVSNDLYLDSNGNLYIATLGGTSGTVKIGPNSGSGVVVNVTGNIYENNVRVCLSNGTNCVSGTNSGNVSSVTKGDSSPLTISPTTGAVSITMSQAGSGTNGWLSSTDWGTFNSKAGTGTATCAAGTVAQNVTTSTGGVTVQCIPVGTGSGNVSGAGTTGTLTKWTGTGIIGDSIISESGSSAAVNGNLLLGSNAVLNTTSGNLTIDSAGGYVIISIG